jgi:hypothetical protein
MVQSVSQQTINLQHMAMREKGEERYAFLTDPKAMGATVLF